MLLVPEIPVHAIDIADLLEEFRKKTDSVWSAYDAIQPSYFKAFQRALLGMGQYIRGVSIRI